MTYQIRKPGDKKYEKTVLMPGAHKLISGTVIEVLEKTPGWRVFEWRDMCWKKTGVCLKRAGMTAEQHLLPQARLLKRTWWKFW